MVKLCIFDNFYATLSILREKTFKWQEKCMSACNEKLYMILKHSLKNESPQIIAKKKKLIDILG